MMYIKLSELKVGSSGIVRSFENTTTSIKLMEMGCVPGEKIKVEKIAPLKDPISVVVAGYSLSLRLEEAENIIIEEII
jgi:ferrous iron transport protein A